MKETAKPTFKYAIVINGNTLAINTTKEELKLNKPSYLGMCILDLKKTPMYDFYYNYVMVIELSGVQFGLKSYA